MLSKTILINNLISKILNSNETKKTEFKITSKKEWNVNYDLFLRTMKLSECEQKIKENEETVKLFEEGSYQNLNLLSFYEKKDRTKKRNSFIIPLFEIKSNFNKEINCDFLNLLDCNFITYIKDQQINSLYALKFKKLSNYGNIINSSSIITKKEMKEINEKLNEKLNEIKEEKSINPETQQEAAEEVTEEVTKDLASEIQFFIYEEKNTKKLVLYGFFTLNNPKILFVEENKLIVVPDLNKSNENNEEVHSIEINLDMKIFKSCFKLHYLDLNNKETTITAKINNEEEDYDLYFPSFNKTSYPLLELNTLNIKIIPGEKDINIKNTYIFNNNNELPEDLIINETCQLIPSDRIYGSSFINNYIKDE